MKQRFLFVLCAVLCLTACDGLFPKLEPTPVIDPVEPMTAEAAYEKIQS